MQGNAAGIRWKTEGRTLILTIDRQNRRNALDPDALAALETALADQPSTTTEAGEEPEEGQVQEEEEVCKLEEVPDIEAVRAGAAAAAHGGGARAADREERQQQCAQQ